MKYLVVNILVFCLLLSSCQKDFLYKSDPTKVNEVNFYKTPADFNQALNGIYGLLQGIALNQWKFSELPSDNTTIDLDPANRFFANTTEQFEFWTVNSVNPENSSNWSRHNAILYNINTALAKLSNAGFAESVKQPVEGQLKFIRAYIYFNLVQYYGEVPLITEVLDDPKSVYKYPRESTEKVWGQIESDLKDAVTLLPEKYSAEFIGRATKGAALSLLGKTYLTLKQYPDAVASLRPVLNLGYSLLPSYKDVFDPKNKNSVESVFEIQFQGGNTLGLGSSFIYMFAPRGSFGSITGFPTSTTQGWNIPTNDIINDYEPGDLRKEVSIGLNFKSSVTGDTIPYVNKYNHPHAIVGVTDDDWPVLRYADVLLMLAEAINEEGGPTEEAYSFLNKVRTRAGLGALSGLDKKAFRDTVLHERRIELAFENQRWFDLKRTKSPAELAAFLNVHGAQERAHPTVSRQGIPFLPTDYKFEAFENIFPIPDDLIMIDNKITQNEGY